MRQWFIRPSLELDIIEARHDAVECLVRDENRASRPLCTSLSPSRADVDPLHLAEPAVDAIESNFKHIKNVRRILKAIAGGDGSLSDWQAIWMVRLPALSLARQASNAVIAAPSSSSSARSRSATPFSASSTARASRLSTRCVQSPH